MSNPFVRPQAHTLAERLAEPRRFIQVVAGPRQVGKTTAVSWALGVHDGPSHYATADEPVLRGQGWIDDQWELGRQLARDNPRAVLALDEVQKLPSWSDSVKRLWDEDTRTRVPLRVVLSGSSPLLVARGLGDSLAGRFETIRFPHWSFAEMSAAFGTDLDTFLFAGGYPAGAQLVDDNDRWRSYMLGSLIETSIARDVLLLSRVEKPALLRRLVEVGCQYSAQVISYTKLLGQLQDAGNTTTLAHYLDLLSGAGLLAAIPKFAGDVARRRASIPKLLAYDTSLISALTPFSLEEARTNHAHWGRLVESSVGAHILAETGLGRLQLSYWREGDREVDWVVRRGDRVLGIEVKSRQRDTASAAGLAAFRNAFPQATTLTVGGDGMPVAAFLGAPVDRLFQSSGSAPPS